VTTHYQLDGQREIKQPDHVVILGATGYTEEPVKFFIFSVRGKKNYPLKLESVQGNYQYYSENPQPLEIKSLTNCEAVLCPTANVVVKPSPKRTEKSGEIKHGRYKIDITYRLNGQDYQCHFDIIYKTENETGMVGPWSGKDIH
jgi:hypothetical protein